MATKPHLSFDWDPEEVTGVDHVTPTSDDPIVNQGMMMASIARLQKQVKEGFERVRQLDGRLKRIEALLYGVGGSLFLAIAEYVRNLLTHGSGAP